MKKILAIDDEQMCLEIISFSLGYRGYKVTAVDSGHKAIDEINNSDEIFDLILLDMMMPGLDGKETLDAIRQIDKAKNIPVLFQTGASQAKIKEEDNLFIIIKPFKREDLLLKVESIIAKQNV